MRWSCARECLSIIRYFSHAARVSLLMKFPLEFSFWFSNERKLYHDHAREFVTFCLFSHFQCQSWRKRQIGLASARYQILRLWAHILQLGSCSHSSYSIQTFWLHSVQWLDSLETHSVRESSNLWKSSWWMHFLLCEVCSQFHTSRAFLSLQIFGSLLRFWIRSWHRA